MASPPTTATPPRGAPAKPGLMLPMRVWDSPVRLFHWALLALLLTSWTSVTFFNSMRVHMWSGQAILVLLLPHAWEYAEEEGFIVTAALEISNRWRAAALPAGA